MHPSDLWKRPEGRPLIMGILNLTPDSFSDGGAYLSTNNALKHAYHLLESGADVIDIGGESSRPGSEPVSEEEEIERIICVIKELAPTIGIPISVDTAKPRVAELSLKAGASIINDIGGLRNDDMTDVAISHDVPAVIVHMHGTPKTFGTDMMEGDALAEIKRFLNERAEHAVGRGLDEKNIILDPGIGFGKNPEQDMMIIQNSGWFGGGYPVLIGPSRKRFLSKHYPRMERDEATAAASGTAAENGAAILRVHNVSAVVQFLERRRSGL
ncbi:MAG: dihydropteroate synthase [Candidatus Methanoplasma sp.]|jgi:dihydropteroate synthase|nr:dihydropteroate synthase [Candidatus Methanoplasma sp.]